MAVVDSPPLHELVRGLGEDGTEYVIRPAQFSLSQLEDLWHRFSKYHIGLDEVTDWNGFLRWLRAAAPVWFEGVRVSDGAQVGLIYLSDFVPMWVGGPGYVQARFHATAWDSDAGSRIQLVKAAIRELLRLFRIHRLEAHIPLGQPGALKVLRRLGFVDEGRLRQTRRFRNEWIDSLVLSILDCEVENGVQPTATTDA